jgi:hypothetical protein
MRRRWAAFACAAGGLLVLASLYLSWWSASPCAGFSCSGVEGWSGEAAPLAALAALVVVVMAIAALVAPDSAWPLTPVALLTAGLVVGLGLSTRSLATSGEIRLRGTHFDAHAGTCLAAAALVLLVAGALATWRPPLLTPRSASGLVLGCAVLFTLFLPWGVTHALGFPGGGRAEFVLRALATAPGQAAAVASAWVIALWWRPDPAGAPDRFAVSAGTAILAGGAFSIVPPQLDRPAASWLGLAFAVALAAVALPGVRPVPSPAGIAAGAAAGVLVVSLFQPWQHICEPGGGPCQSVEGWSTSMTGAVILALAIAFAALEDGRLPALALEAAAGAALLTATSGFEITRSSDVTVGYGAVVGFAAAAALVVVAVTGTRVRLPGRIRALELLPPVAAILGYLAVVALSWWRVLPPFGSQTLFELRVTWLTIAGALLAILLLGAWLRADARWLVAIPLAMLALLALDLIRDRNGGMTWGDGIVVVLCLALAALGRVEQQGGLRRFDVPGILRIDRI